LDLEDHEVEVEISGYHNWKIWIGKSRWISFAFHQIPMTDCLGKGSMWDPAEKAKIRCRRKSSMYSQEELVANNNSKKKWKQELMK